MQIRVIGIFSLEPRSSIYSRRTLTKHLLPTFLTVRQQTIPLYALSAFLLLETNGLGSPEYYIQKRRKEQEEKENFQARNRRVAPGNRP